MRRHELEPVSLTFGFVFTGLGLLFLIGQADQALRVRWVWPVLLLVLGLGILFDVARSRDRTDRTPSPEPTLTPEPDAEPTHAPDPDPGSARAPDPDPGSDADPDLAPEPDRDPDLAPEPDPDPEVAVDRREQPS